MNLEIKSKTENPLLHRIEVRAELNFTGSTPSKEAVKKQIAEKTASKPELTIIKEIKTAFGLEKASVLAYVYKDEENMKKIEPKEGKKKKGEGKKPKEEKKEPEKPAEAKGDAKKEETPKKEAKPEAKDDNKEEAKK
ncbi:MAG: hypothetical protein QF362_00940 [Candidatus Woesearchaeota archaeon]|jgi:small subunit ribosomal protein S24e|nr:hypothetical protein [Candidatus Woesearchaeota archaeon]MDP7505996.1 hypothetical protein [Candidatus Woesearchaeota archaeon]MDP7610459.1 hypothetical protein [Candidatus Woesearchaeota archaeon]|tara:strand:- start:562 stop:972 length:411 start_codon:yes stop_codon:yes gene_type:complete